MVDELNLKNFTQFCYYPLKWEGEDGDMTTCGPDDPDIVFWSVYGQNGIGMWDWLADCATRQTASLATIAYAAYAEGRVIPYEG